MPAPTVDRWKCDVLNPADLQSVVWTFQAPSIQQIKNKWDEECPDNKVFLNNVKLNRASANRLKNALIRVYRIGEFGSRPVQLSSN